jgi:hypothetical protein
MEFHYSWLLILIALEAWEKPKYSVFCDRRGKCGATRYKTLCDITHILSRGNPMQEFFHVHIGDAGENCRYMEDFT